MKIDTEVPFWRGKVVITVELLAVILLVQQWLKPVGPAPPAPGLVQPPDPVPPAPTETPDPVVWQGWTGITPRMEPGRGIRVVASETPAKAASVAPGDLIFAINGVAIESLSQAEQLLRASGPEVELKIQSAGGALNPPHRFPLNRAETALR